MSNKMKLIMENWRKTVKENSMQGGDVQAAPATQQKPKAKPKKNPKRGMRGVPYRDKPSDYDDPTHLIDEAAPTSAHHIVRRMKETGDDALTAMMNLLDWDMEDEEKKGEATNWLERNTQDINRAKRELGVTDNDRLKTKLSENKGWKWHVHRNSPRWKPGDEPLPEPKPIRYIPRGTMGPTRRHWEKRKTLNIKRELPPGLQKGGPHGCSIAHHKDNDALGVAYELAYERYEDLGGDITQMELWSYLDATLVEYIKDCEIMGVIETVMGIKDWTTRGEQHV